MAVSISISVFIVWYTNYFIFCLCPFNSRVITKGNFGVWQPTRPSCIARRSATTKPCESGIWETSSTAWSSVRSSRSQDPASASHQMAKRSPSASRMVGVLISEICSSFDHWYPDFCTVPFLLFRIAASVNVGPRTRLRYYFIFL